MISMNSLLQPGDLHVEAVCGLHWHHHSSFCAITSLSLLEAWAFDWQYGLGQKSTDRKSDLHQAHISDLFEARGQEA